MAPSLKRGLFWRGRGGMHLQRLRTNNGNQATILKSTVYEKRNFKSVMINSKQKVKLFDPLIRARKHILIRIQAFETNFLLPKAK
jgi:hypothetical protein